MSIGNGSVLAAVEAGDETARLLLNAHMYERGLARYVISKSKWNAWRPHPNFIEAIRSMSRLNKDDDE